MTAYMQRFFHNAPYSNEKYMVHLKVLNLKTAFYVCMCRVQYAVYHMVIADLKSSREVKKSNEVHNLHNSSLSYDNQHQVILTSCHHLTEPIVRLEHQKLLYVGPW